MARITACTMNSFFNLKSISVFFPRVAAALARKGSVVSRYIVTFPLENAQNILPISVLQRKS